jgi:hypothetical protein
MQAFVRIVSNEAWEDIMLARDIRVESFEDAMEQLAGQERRRLCRNTVLSRTLGSSNAQSMDVSTIAVCVRLHETYIVRYWFDGVVNLDSGGYQTKVTMRRINQCLPDGYRLYQERNVWWLTRRTVPTGSSTTRRFEDGMELNRTSADDSR